MRATLVTSGAFAATLVAATSALTQNVTIKPSAGMTTTEESIVRRGMIRTEVLYDGGFTFVDLLTDENFDFENVYGETRKGFGIGKGFSIGGQVDFGNGFKDRWKPFVGYTGSLDSGFLSTRLYPIDSNGDQEHSIAGSKRLGDFNMSFWNDLRYREGREWFNMGEVELDYKRESWPIGIYGRFEYTSGSVGFQTGASIDLFR